MLRYLRRQCLLLRRSPKFFFADFFPNILFVDRDKHRARWLCRLDQPARYLWACAQPELNCAYLVFVGRLYTFAGVYALVEPCLILLFIVIIVKPVIATSAAFATSFGHNLAKIFIKYQAAFFLAGLFLFALSI